LACIFRYYNIWYDSVTFLLLTYSSNILEDCSDLVKNLLSRKNILGNACVYELS
jgi:hypothetical protein